MLDRLTGGWYLSTPHRVRNDSGHERLSFPLFFDPAFAAAMVPLPPEAAKGPGPSATPRWAGPPLRAFTATYGDSLLRKASKGRRGLGGEVLARSDGSREGDVWYSEGGLQGGE